MDIETARTIALGFMSTEEKPHFDRPSFRVKDKIFLTLDTKNNHAVMKFTEKDQSVFMISAPSVIYPVPGKWGLKGWSIVELGKITDEQFIDALTVSYCTVAPAKLADIYRQE